jgi:hypothetical protein
VFITDECQISPDWAKTVSQRKTQNSAFSFLYPHCVSQLGTPKEFSDRSRIIKQLAGDEERRSRYWFTVHESLANSI